MDRYFVDAMDDDGADELFALMETPEWGRLNAEDQIALMARYLSEDEARAVLLLINAGILHGREHPPTPN